MNVVYKQPTLVFQQPPSILTKLPYPSINFTKIPPGSYIKPLNQEFPVSTPVPPSLLSNYMSNPQPPLPPLLTTAESTYVPYSSKFSLDKIDQQL